MASEQISADSDVQPGRARIGWTVWALWIVNVIVLGGLWLWALADHRFTLTVHAAGGHARALFGQGVVPPPGWPPVATRIAILTALSAVAIVSFVGVFAALFFGPKQHRRLWSWLAFVALTAAWLTFIVTWPDAAWFGQQRRLQANLDGFESLAAPLRADWPAADGERPLLGPFMAYPVGQPRIILLLTTPRAPGTEIAVAAVEQSANGALRFQLARAETGAWLEWHPPGAAPASFTGGLQEDYILERASPLGRGWWLVRYEGGEIVVAPH